MTLRPKYRILHLVNLQNTLMRYRRLGSSCLVVSEIGFGTWGIGGATEGASSYGPTDTQESVKAIERAAEEGINFFDTATAYGQSELLLGQTFKGSRRQRMIIATKVGIAKHHAPPDFSKTAMIASLENSLKRLQTDYIDLCQLYNPSFTDLPMEDVLGALKQLKDRGLIRAIGASVKSPNDGLLALSFPEIEVIQTNLNMLDQRAIDNGLLEAAKQQGVGIIARTPLCFGFLTGTVTNLDFSPQDHRSEWPKKQLEAWQKGAEIFSKNNPYPNTPLSQFALRFCLDSRGISTVIPGPLTVNEVLENSLASKLPPLDPEVIKQIQNIYKDNGQFFVKPS